MKLILSRISEGEEEVIIRYREMNEKIGTIISFLQGTGQKRILYRSRMRVFMRGFTEKAGSVGDILYY